MLDYQVKYWANKETERSNKAKEEIQRESNRIAARQADTAQQQANINLMNAETQRYSAEAGARYQSDQSKIGYYNAETNRYGMKADAINDRIKAEASQLQAESSYTNAQMKSIETFRSSGLIPAQIASLYSSADLNSSRATLTDKETKWYDVNAFSNVFRNITSGINDISRTVRGIGRSR